MKEGRSLVELATELERQRETKRDFLADSRELEMVQNGNDVDVMVGVKDGAAKFGSFPLTDHAHRQVAQRTQISADYYDRMRHAAPELLARNVNHWLHAEPEKRMVRTLDRKMRAFVSDSYRPLENIDLAGAFLPIAHELGAQPRSMEVTETRMYLRVVLPLMEAEVKVGQPVRWGVSVSNSEVGSGALRIEEFLEVLRCTNGMTIGTALRKSHVGRAKGEDVEGSSEFYSDATKALDDAAFWSKFRDAVRGVMTRERFESAVARLKASTEKKISGDVLAAVDITTKHFRLHAGEQSNVLRHLIEGGDLTAWGLSNAITRTAQDAPTFDRAYELEKAGSAVITLPATDWKRIATAETRAVAA